MRVLTQNRPNATLVTNTETDVQVQDNVKVVQPDNVAVQQLPPSSNPIVDVAQERSTTVRQPQAGKLSQIDLKSWQPDKLIETLVNDLKVGFSLLRRMPPAVTVFGGARIKPDDPYYAKAVEFGRLLAMAGVAGRTGAAHAGIMEAIPKGMKEVLDEAREASVQMQAGFIEVGALKDVPVEFQPLVDGYAKQADIPSSKTQGFNIKLPHEQKISPFIDKCVEIAEFLYRKVMLYENSRGLVTWPGGYGSLDELFQVWALAVQGRHNDPMALFGTPFWKPMLDPIHEQAVVKRHLIDETDWRKMGLFDEPAELLEFMAEATNVRGFEEDPDVLSRRMTEEITTALTTLTKLPEAVSFVGGEKLAANDPTLAVARRAAELLAQAGVAMRVGVGDPVVRAVADGAHKADPDAALQGFALEPSKHQMKRGQRSSILEECGVKEELRVKEYTTHRELMSRRTEAMVALPGDITTLHHVFALLCEIQCGKVPKNPVVLVGKDYWEPIFKAIEQIMLNGTRQTIAPQDLKLFVITDDPEVVAKTIIDARVGAKQ